MFSNNLNCEIHATRFIMSWVREGGELKRNGRGYDEFEAWLRSLIIDGKHLSDQDVNHILDLAKTGKMEFEFSAREFIKKHKN